MFAVAARSHPDRHPGRGGCLRRGRAKAGARSVFITPDGQRRRDIEGVAALRESPAALALGALPILLDRADEIADAIGTAGHSDSEDLRDLLHNTRNTTGT